ncbi:MAG: RNA-guided endonuclease InsQ/TnpB family protein [Desulfomonilaceae bacterium]
MTEKVLLDPTPAQRKWLWTMSVIATILYNIALEQRRGWWLRYHGLKTGINYKFQNAQLVDLKESFPEFNCLYSLVAQEVLRLLQKNFNSFFGRLKSQKKKGEEVTARPPRFKSSKIFFTLSYIQSGFSLKGGKLVLSGGMEECIDKKGRKKLRQHKEVIQIAGYRKLPKDVHSLTITCNDGNFYANLTYEVKPMKVEIVRSLKVMAFDPGVKTFLTGADDSGRLMEFESLIRRATKYFDEQIDRVKSLRDKCKRGSRRWRRLSNTLHVLYQRRNAQVNDELHSIAKLLSEGEWDLIGVGNPDKPSMVSDDPEKGHGNQNINRAVQNNWPLKKWIRFLNYKLEYRGKLYLPVDERYTTQDCNYCGHRMKLDPSVRVYQCPECGMVLGRDENSAINILNRVVAGLYQPKKTYKDFKVRITFHRTLSGKWSHKDRLIESA